MGPDTLSWFSIRALRAYPSESNAPAKIRLSRTRFVSTDGSTLRQKSPNEANAPLARRASMICPTAPSPTLRTADNP